MRAIRIVFFTLIALFVASCGSENHESCEIQNGIEANLDDWGVRFGSVALINFPSPSSDCGANSDNIVLRITTGRANAIILDWKNGIPNLKERRVSYNFMIPSVQDWSHIAAFGAYRPPLEGSDPNSSYAFGRLGVDVSHDPTGIDPDKLIIQYDNAGLPLYLGTNLHDWEEVPGGLLENHWYRLENVITKTEDGGLQITGTLTDLDGTFFILVEQEFPSSSVPPWYDGPDTRPAIGILDLIDEQNIDTYIDAVSISTK